MCALIQWTCWDSDPGPPPCKGGALPAELQALNPGPAYDYKLSWLLGFSFLVSVDIFSLLRLAP